MKSNNIDNSIISLLLVVMSVMIALIAFTLTSCTKIDDVEIPNNDTITVRELSVIDIGIVDGSGNRYDTIRIGNQVWLDANLITTKYNDSTDILYPGIIRTNGYHQMRAVTLGITTIQLHIVSMVLYTIGKL